MERPLTVLGSLAVAVLLTYGVTTAFAKDDPPPSPPVPRATPSRDALSFETLHAYEYEQGLRGLPDAIKALDGKTVSMRGFILPLYEFEDIREFALVPNVSCCFVPPFGINGHVYVKLKGAGLPNTNEPIEVTGTFHARERVEQGYLMSIWELVDAVGHIGG